jgi:PAS domain S-box-containing protein
MSWLLALSRPVLAHEAHASRDTPLGHTKFRVFGPADGLRNLVIASIAQDANGFLWLGTEDGVYRFDGERFTRFPNESYVVGVGPDGNACVGYRTGLACWDGTGFSRARTHGMPEIPISTMASFAGKLWVGTDGAGLYVGDASGAFAPAPGWPGLKTTAIRALWADDDGLVVGDGATVQLSSGDGAWRAIGDVGLGPERIDAVLRDRRGALWIRTPMHMWVLPRGAARAIDVSAGLPTHYELMGVPTGMAISPRGDVLVGTDVGVAYRDGDHWHLIDRSVGMPAASTRALLVDREGTLWLGAAGLFQLRGRGIVEHHDAASGLPGETVWTFQRDPGGTLWVGTNRCLARAVEGRWECLPGTEGRVVRSIVSPPQGGMFIGGAPSDLLYIDADGRATSLGNHDWPAEATILALALGPDRALWIATKAGLYRLPGAVPGPLEHVAIPGVRPEARFASVIATGDQVWTATDEGALVLDHGTWRRFDATAGLPSSVMRRVIARADGRMCVTYNAAIGLSCFRYHGDSISDVENIGPAQGLTAGMVYFLGEDRQRRLWIGTGDGVDVVTPNGIDHFDENSGLAGNDSSARAFLVDDDGSLWLGATGGATHVFAQYYERPPAQPGTAFLGGRLGERAIAVAHAALETPHDRNALTLEFASSSLLDSKRVEYAMRLSPTETRWSVTHQHQARYPALLPDSYRFEVRARIGAGAWGPTTELRFDVLPAWWQTRWFLVALGLAVAAAIMWRQRFVLVRRTQQLHARSDASFRAVIDLMPDLISVYRDRKLIYLNVANRRFLGVDDQDDRSNQLQLIDRIHPDDRHRVAELFRRVGELEPGDSSAVIELQMRGADGSWRICEVSAIRVDIGGALTVVASGRDVTERKRMHAKLLVSDRMASLGTLAAGIAHEINNPLAYVAGNLEAMAETLSFAKRSASAADCDELSAVVNDARDGAERVRKIVQGLRSFSRSEQREQRAALALADVLESAIRLTGNELRHRAQLVRELGPVPPVIADDGRLTQVFINLLVNAAHAIPEGHAGGNRITVRTRTDARGRAVAEVEDTGKGMPPEVAARVFDPFFTTKDVGEGTGLGLSICHGIISGLGGQISIDSAPGRGTIVRVVLPPQVEQAMPAPAPAPIVEPSRADPGERRHRVMLVDDEPQVAQTMERLLRRDYDVTLAGCGRDAVDLINRGARFDAIVSDVMMPNMTGIELIEELQRIAPDQAQRLIFLSGGAFTAQTRERLDQLGAPQLEKPVTARELRACLKRVAVDADQRAA